jgi:putative membrane protein
MFRYGRFCVALISVFSVIWVALAVAPHDRADWLLENVLTFLAVPLIVLSFWVLPLSRISYFLIFVFMCLHSLGAHYTYGLVPYDAWSEALFGQKLNAVLGWERNHFDRLVHFSYGLLLAYPVRELFFRVANARGFWSYFLPLDVVMSTSMLFELIEWGVAVNVGGDLGMAYLGTQGDIWDAHKDMALASLGALLAMLVTMGINRKYQQDFAREWQQSLRLKVPEPLGERVLARFFRRRGD